MVTCSGIMFLKTSSPFSKRKWVDRVPYSSNSFSICCLDLVLELTKYFHYLLSVASFLSFAKLLLIFLMNLVCS